MRVLILNNVRASKEYPKRGSYVTNIGDCIKAAGFDVEYLLPRSLANSPGHKLLAYIGLYADILRYKLSAFDLLYINHYPYLALPLLAKLPFLGAVAIHWHGEDLLPPARMKSWLFTPLISMIPNRVHHFVPSQYFKTVLLNRISNAQVTVTPSGGINLERFRVKKARGHGEKVRMGFASGLEEGKGLVELKRIIKNLHSIETATGKTIELHYIDYGPDKGALDRDQQQLQNKIKRWPMQKSEGMVNFYNGIDILLFPTKREAESLGLVPLEAMACGVPVLAPDAYACPEYVIPGLTGELFDPNDALDVVRQLIHCIKQLDHYQPRGLIEEKYAFRTVIRQYQEHLPKILGA